MKLVPVRNVARFPIVIHRANSVGMFRNLTTGETIWEVKGQAITRCLIFPRYLTQLEESA